MYWCLYSLHEFIFLEYTATYWFLFQGRMSLGYSDDAQAFREHWREPSRHWRSDAWRFVSVFNEVICPYMTGISDIYNALNPIPALSHISNEIDNYIKILTCWFKKWCWIKLAGLKSKMAGLNLDFKMAGSRADYMLDTHRKIYLYYVINNAG